LANPSRVTKLAIECAKEEGRRSLADIKKINRKTNKPVSDPAVYYQYTDSQRILRAVKAIKVYKGEEMNEKLINTVAMLVYLLASSSTAMEVERGLSNVKKLTDLITNNSTGKEYWELSFGRGMLAWEESLLTVVGTIFGCEAEVVKDSQETYLSLFGSSPKIELAAFLLNLLHYRVGNISGNYINKHRIDFIGLFEEVMHIQADSDTMT
jgi:hypothetical protein